MTKAPLSITVLICTHNRRDLLERTLASLNAAERPRNASVDFLVVANACTDGTHAFLERYSREVGDRIPLKWVAELTPGKSHALNRAIPMLESDVVAFVDDDHRVDVQYLTAIADAALAHPRTDLFCGRILPDWDGSEPAWVHDKGQYRVYPLPVPHFELGTEPLDLNGRSSIPGGGNLVARSETAKRTGEFSTDLGPMGHNLGGAEDLDWVRRALRNGARLRYEPGIVQYHYVDGERLTLPYLMRKGYERSKSTVRLHRLEDTIPAYALRKLAEYGVAALTSFGNARRRFFLVRFASALGELGGMVMNRADARRRAALPRLAFEYAVAVLVALAAAGLIGALSALPAGALARATLPAAIAASAFAAFLIVRSIQGYSRTGPQIREEIRRRFGFYTVWALARLGTYVWFICFFFALLGVAAYDILLTVAGGEYSALVAVLAGAAAVFAAFAVQLAGFLVYNPGLVVAAWSFRLSRLNALRRILGPLQVRGMRAAIGLFALAVIAAGLAHFLAQGELRRAFALVSGAVGLAAAFLAVLWEPEQDAPRRSGRKTRPNVVMIGSDTLRADRICNRTGPRSVAPTIDRLAEHGTYFANCYVPCARTAPSLFSLFSGTWPHTHGVRDNFVERPSTRLPVTMLPEHLARHDYRSAVISDWCGADMRKFAFGFDIVDIPEDQWNLKYFIRQGPKDLRLFLSLFTHNRFGRLVLPEIYFQGGVPLTGQLGRRARNLLRKLGSDDRPFFLNVFYSTTHPPFASEYPYYMQYTDPRYDGESKFAMARLTDPFDIIRRQGDTKQEFDIDHILQLYDGCVTQFDAEIARMLDCLRASGLDDDTIVVVYSDHGMEFFEHGTWGQGNSAVGDFSARIPLLILDPRRAGGGYRHEVVRSIDLVPTILDLLDIPASGYEGVSLRPLVDGAGSDPSLPAFNETGIWITHIPGLPPDHIRYPELFDLLDVVDKADGTLVIKDTYRDTVIAAKDRMIRRDRWKLVYQPLETGKLLKLFDVEADPECREDLSARHPEKVEQLWRELESWIKAG